MRILKRSFGIKGNIKDLGTKEETSTEEETIRIRTGEKEEVLEEENRKTEEGEKKETSCQKLKKNPEDLELGLDPEEDKAGSKEEDQEVMEETASGAAEKEGQVPEDPEENPVQPEMCSTVTLNQVTQSSSQRLKTKRYWTLVVPKLLVANIGSECTSKA